MRIRMNISMSGTRNGEDWPPRGSVVDLPDDEAQHYIDNGTAEPAPGRDDEPDEERAVAPAPETRRGRGRPSKE